jgi:tetratricopeptide (TPR) repeat protein
VTTVLETRPESGKSSSFLATGEALAGAAWERVVERLIGPEVEAGDRVGRYVLLEEIGAGGMGVVWAAWDPELDRRIALKLLHPSTRALGGGRRDALLVEARALAQLSHGNVVTVFDAGTEQGRLFLAMEFVDGVDLDAWLAERPRAWREIVAIFREAGRGLAAAHAAGFVHHDFKPHNVLVGRDGRVRVADFGLARACLGSGAVPDGAPVSVAGTPGYMAPEQLRGELGDPRSDQFAFCVALWEALYGQRPRGPLPRGETPTGSRAAARPETPRRRVPRRIQRILQRGLAFEPDERWPDLETLLAVLDDDPRRRWIRRALLAGGTLAAAAWVIVGRGTGREVCGGFDAALRGVWNDARRADLDSGFAGAGPGGAAAAAAAFGALDAWAGEWVAERTAACVATRVDGEQPVDLLDLRVACLDRRLQELDGLLGVLLETEPEGLVDAPKSILALESPEICADRELLAAPVKPPHDPAARLLIGAVERRIAAVKANRDAGRLDVASEEVEAARVDAERLGYAPLRAEVEYLRADVAERRADYEIAEASAFAAWTEAIRGGHEEIAIRTLSLLTFLDGIDRARFASARRWAELGRARLSRLVGGAPHLAAQLASDLGSVAQAEGRLERALAEHQHALELRRSLYGPESVEAARSLNNLGNVLYALGRFEHALERYRRAEQLLSAAVGPDHPDTIMAVSNAGSALNELGRYVEARREHERALAARVARFGSGGIWWAISEMNLGYDELDERPDRALERFDAAERVLASELPAEHPQLAAAAMGRARAHLALGHADRALPAAERALEIQERVGMNAAYELARLRFLVARARLGAGGAARIARQEATRALETLDPEESGHAPLRREIEEWLGSTSGPGASPE